MLSKKKEMITEIKKLVPGHKTISRQKLNMNPHSQIQYFLTEKQTRKIFPKEHFTSFEIMHACRYTLTQD